MLAKYIHTRRPARYSHGPLALESMRYANRLSSRRLGLPGILGFLAQRGMLRPMGGMLPHFREATGDLFREGDPGALAAAVDLLIDAGAEGEDRSYGPNLATALDRLGFMNRANMDSIVNPANVFRQYTNADLADYEERARREYPHVFGGRHHASGRIESLHDLPEAIDAGTEYFNTAGLHQQGAQNFFDLDAIARRLHDYGVNRARDKRTSNAR